MSGDDLRKLAHEVIRAGMRDQPLPAIPEGVPSRAVKYCYELGVMYRQLDELKRND